MIAHLGRRCRNRRTAAWICLCSAVILIVAALAVARAADAPAGAQAEELADRWSSQLKSYNDYEFYTDSETTNGKKHDSSSLHIWFMCPELIRIKVVKGSHHGSEIALNRSGRVHARSGGILGAIRASMSKTDSRLRDEHGDYAWETDLGTACRKLHEAIHRSEKTEFRSLPESRAEISCTYADPTTHSERREVWTFDTGTPALLSREAYQDGARVEHVIYRDLKTNVGLKESFFDL